MDYGNRKPRSSNIFTPLLMTSDDIYRPTESRGSRCIVLLEKQLPTDATARRLPRTSLPLIFDDVDNDVYGYLPVTVGLMGRVGSSFPAAAAPSTAPALASLQPRTTRVDSDQTRSCLALIMKWPGGERSSGHYSNEDE